MTKFPYGFRLVGAFAGERRLVDWAAAFAAYAACDPRAELDREGYLSAFTYGEDFLARKDPYGTVDTAGFEGACCAPFLWWDLDREGDLELALREARRLAHAIDERFRLASEDDLLVFLSGNKGFHLGLPTALWVPEPCPDFHRVARRFAVRMAEIAGVGVYDARRGYRVDEGVYSKVQPFRAPNSRHPKSGRYKRRLRFDELMGLSVERILQLAEAPEPFDLPAPAYRSEQAGTDWREAVEAVARETAARAERQRAPGQPRLNRGTWDYLCRGAEVGDRHRLLFSAAANFGEFPDLPSLAHAILTERALEDGLAVWDAARQIDCGLRHSRAAAGAGQADEPPPESEPQPAPTDLRAALATMWASQAAEPAHAPEDIGLSDGGEPPVNRDVAELHAEREAIAAEGALPDPPEPPPGVPLIYADEQGRSCGAAEAKLWAWEGAPRWFRVDDFPPP